MNINSDYVNTKEACRLYQVSVSTLRRWDKKNRIDTIRTPSNIRLYATNVYTEAINNSSHSDKKQKICYCRVSSNSQKNDLQRQIEYMQSKFPQHTIIQDIGSDRYRTLSSRDGFPLHRAKDDFSRLLKFYGSGAGLAFIA